MKTSDITDEEILNAIREYGVGRAPTPDIALAHKYPVKVIMSKMRKLSDKGVLDYGVSLRTAWIVGESGSV
jgi:hypothetical protein